MRNQTRWVRGLGVVVAVAAAQASLAREELAEIVVTAQKREQNLQDVPVAVSALSGAQLSDAGVIQPVSLAEVTPNLTAKNAVGNTAPIFALRGIGLNDFATNGTQPVGVYLDEVYLANNSQLSGGHGPLLWFGVITVALCYASFLTAVVLGSARTAAHGAQVRL